MYAVIPAKTNSTRIPNKNFKEFDPRNGDSLTDILIKKLLKVFKPGDIFLSSENYDVIEPFGEKYGIIPISREERFTDNDCPFKAWFNDTYRDVCRQTAPRSFFPTIMWCQVTDPIFNDHAAMLRKWNEINDYDSMVALYPCKGYFLDDRFRPQGWGFGPWHVKSQNLPQMYEMPFTCSILNSTAMTEVGYHIGATPHYMRVDSPKIDIDTPHDWDYAQYLYQKAFDEDANPIGYLHK